MNTEIQKALEQIAMEESLVLAERGGLDFRGIDADTTDNAVKERSTRTVGVMVERVHRLRKQTVFQSVAVPAFPDGGRSLKHRIEPGGESFPEHKFCCDICPVETCEYREQERCSEEAGGEMEIVRGDVFDQLCKNIFPVTFRSEIELQSEKCRGLARFCQFTVRIDESFAEIFMGFGMHCLYCPMGQQETLEEASAVHDIDVELLVKKLNERKEELKK